MILIIVHFVRGDVMSSRVERAKKISVDVGELLTRIVRADSDPIEDTANYTNISIIFLREIMYNTAIIADKLNDKNTNRKAGDLGDEDKPEKIDA